ncbi:MAG TPA: fumarate hydratase [Candidatus Acidoferrales bacterium]|nr:fumarate hydratase [Candidatus Acidoferrales bacterium]
MSASSDVDLYGALEVVARDLYIKALQEIPLDVRAGLTQALATEQRDGNRTAGRILLVILDNIRVADEQKTLVCQDTGLPIFKVSVGGKLRVDIPRLKESLRKGCARATAERQLRSNTVHPLTREHTGTNTGSGIPVIKLDVVPDSDCIAIQMAPKGSGSENMSFLRMLNPAEGVQGIKKFVLQCIFESGARPCPPMIVGIGLGGTSDVAMALAKEASTFRHIGTCNPDPDVAKLEGDLLQLINATGIGPQGLGGTTTAMAVNIEWAHTHISQNPVAVNIQCWRGERAEAVVDAGGRITWK